MTDEIDEIDDEASQVAVPRICDAVADAADVDQRLRSALAGTAEILARPAKLTTRDGKVPRYPEETARAAGSRAASCSGGASRLAPYLRHVDHPLAGQVRAQHAELLAAEARWMAIEKANK
ncbi:MULTISPECIES: hypothetical protein [unclassified Methylobacterium]|uniref:hypothetical protein n=1 Tax=unclassified Methylobacterium TaxID=2615210 RepID=UPI0011C1E197|nr:MULTISPECIES: hypothetical protein [unclassified Methylobacterium]QEE39920.1 hypothetical protein FVA80_14100 [Methylobacterium sp. WL1]TXN56586.1 hypothetical protein FV241_14755 [Methylobacterium sp. WL2]